MSRTWSKDLSEENSLTMADAVMFVGLPDMVISLSKAYPQAILWWYLLYGMVEVV